MPPKKTVGGKMAAKKKTKAKTARAKTATKKKTKANTVGAKSASRKKTKTKPVKVNQGPKKGKKVTVQGNKPAPPKMKANPKTGMKSTNNKPKAGAVKRVVGPQKRKNPNPAEGQSLAKKKRKSPACNMQSTSVTALPKVQRSVASPPTILPVCMSQFRLSDSQKCDKDNMPVPALTQPSVHVVAVPVGNFTVQTSGRSDFCQPSGGPTNRFNNGDTINQGVTNNAAVCAQRDQIDNSQTGSDNIQDENLLFLRKNNVKLIDGVKNVPEILDRLELTNEKAAIVRAERTDQERMRKLLEFTTSTHGAKFLVTALWSCASDVMEDLANTN
ncbi:uncharacterized protein LOC128608495 isoform X2 [Ictalurus furcatus]|uniref:uncharacterized protein LOC128608495 isoform X2 n=1 Tax=Ictalurus furcatus TaxID=66913 RepID=UPI00234FC4B6|nr:uncharacterized protein LOC128608495 isoform X2 [Ictalurus furcatus]